MGEKCGGGAWFFHSVLTGIIGLIASALFYLAVVSMLVWTGKRRMKWGERHGVQFSPEPRFPSAGELLRLHRVEMTVIYGLAFVALALADFTSVERLGFAALAALVFGSMVIANESRDLALPGASSVRRATSKVGYWSLAVLLWFGYMGVLCFAAAVVVDLT